MIKKIWILNHYATDMYYNKGGRHYWFAKNLIKKGYEPIIFCASTRHNRQDVIEIETGKFKVETSDGIQFVFIKTPIYKGIGKQRIKNMIVFYMNLITSAVEYAKDSGKADIIIASSVHPLTWLAGYNLSKRYNIKFIAETRDLWPEGLVAIGRISRKNVSTKILYKLERFIYKKADKLIFTFQGGKDYVRSIGMDTSKVRYINNGIDIDEFNYNRGHEQYYDRDLDNEATFKIIYTGSLGQSNALEYLLEAAKIIKNKGITSIKFIIFGEGYQKQELIEYSKVNDLTNVFFKGKIDKKFIPNILSKSSLNVFTGKYIYLYKYGLSLNKMFDYFASGKPTISNIECGYDMLKKYNCGITVKGGSPETLAEGILKFYNMPEQEYNIYCQNALKAAQDFDFKILTDKLEKIILED